MFINPVDRNRLARSVQREYLKASEQRRMMENSQLEKAGVAPCLKIGLAVTTLISLIIVASQFLSILPSKWTFALSPISVSLRPWHSKIDKRRIQDAGDCARKRRFGAGDWDRPFPGAAA